MKIRTKVVGVFAATLLTFSAMSGAYADSSGDMTVRVVAPSDATLFTWISNGIFSTVTYQVGNGSQNSFGSFDVYAKDTRGVGSGWTVSIRSGTNTFFTIGGSQTFPVSGLKLYQGNVQPVNGESTVGIGTSQVDSMTTGAQSIMTAQANAGMGTFKNQIGAILSVPDGTLVGDYHTTLIVNITAAP